MPKSPIHPSPELVTERKAQVRETLCCPYCEQKFTRYDMPNEPWVEWDTEYMYICFNDACPYVIRGAEAMRKQGLLNKSHRLMWEPKRGGFYPTLARIGAPGEKIRKAS